MMIGSIGIHGKSKARNVDNRNILGFNVDTSNMKYPFFIRQLLGDSGHSGRSNLAKLAIAPDTRGTRNTRFRNQSQLRLLVSDFDRHPPQDAGLLYGILKRSIIGGP
jgi:hypothetical protein